MHLSKITAMSVATLFATAPVALAQTSAPSQTKSTATATAAVQTFTGCLMTETAYRSAHHLGSGALNGVGLGDEFVLVDAKVSPANASADTMSSSSSTAPVASTSATAKTCADTGVAYRLTGTQEEKIKPMNIVGHEIEVQGRFKHADDVTPSGAPTSGNLPAEVEIVSFREAPAPAAVAEPMPPATPPAPAPRTVTPPPPPPTPAPEPVTPAPTTPTELPHTAGSNGMIALIGLFALGSGLLMAAWRRRVV
jgi:hypothetical protein